jgi:hypothetical protein
MDMNQTTVPAASQRPIDQLLEAKGHSDMGDYSSKHRIVRKMLEEQPEAFKIDSTDGDILGITHLPTGFKMHVPRVIVPQPKLPVVKTAKFDDATWKDVPVLAVKYAVATAPLVEALYSEPYEGDIWVSPETSKLAYAAMGDYPDFENEPWVRVKSATTVGEVMNPMGQIFGNTEGPLNSWYGGPRPAASALAGGLLGTGLGYAGGSLAEWLMPHVFTPGAAKTRAALLGGVMGAVPGAAGMALNHSEGKSIFDKAAALQQTCKLVIGDQEVPTYVKFATLIFKPIINVHHFNDAIWADPFSDESVQAMASGLVYGAGATRNSNVVTPMDVARVAVGMGTGYASATLLGKTLGTLAGISPQAQGALQQAGIWSGLMKSVVDPVMRFR